MSALTIYECPAHGPQGLPPYDYPCAVCGAAVREVRVFREEDVRPLWQAANGRYVRELIEEAVDAFPAPADW